MISGVACKGFIGKLFAIKFHMIHGCASGLVIRDWVSQTRCAELSILGVIIKAVWSSSSSLPTELGSLFLRVDLHASFDVVLLELTIWVPTKLIIFAVIIR